MSIAKPTLESQVNFCLTHQGSKSDTYTGQRINDRRSVPLLPVSLPQRKTELCKHRKDLPLNLSVSLSRTRRTLRVYFGMDKRNEIRPMHCAHTSRPERETIYLQVLEYGVHVPLDTLEGKVPYKSCVGGFGGNRALRLSSSSTAAVTSATVAIAATTVTPVPVQHALVSAYKSQAEKHTKHPSRRPTLHSLYRNRGHRRSILHLDP